MTGGGASTGFSSLGFSGSAFSTISNLTLDFFFGSSVVTLNLDFAFSGRGTGCE